MNSLKCQLFDKRYKVGNSEGFSCLYIELFSLLRITNSKIEVMIFLKIIFEKHIIEKDVNFLISILLSVVLLT